MKLPPETFQKYRTLRKPTPSEQKRLKAIMENDPFWQEWKEFCKPTGWDWIANVEFSDE